MYYSEKMFNFLERKDLRKMLKRKDSDAGERGTFSLLRVCYFGDFFFFLQCSCDIKIGFADFIM